MSKTVVQVGAGPVGLYTAIQIKLRCKDTDIIIYEKYKQYTRHHVLKLNRSSFAQCHEDFYPIVDEFFKDQNIDEIKIKTNDIEDTLLKLAQQLDIKIIYEEVKDIDDLIQDHPNVDLIIGSDGSHSVIREKVFGNDFSFNEDLNFMAQVKYQIEGDIVPLDWYGQAKALLTSNHLLSEQIGKLKDNKTPVSIFSFIDSNAYENLKNANAKNPISLQELAKIDDKLYTSFRNWIDVRTDKVDDDEKVVSVTKLPVYCSSNFVKDYKLDNDYATKVVLVGDSAFGFPYFVNFNLGLKSATQLSKSIDAFLYGTNNNQEVNYSFIKMFPSNLDSVDKYDGFNKEPLQAYERFVTYLTDNEIKKAKFKNTKIGIGESSLYVSQQKVQFVNQKVDFGSSLKCTIL